MKNPMVLGLNGFGLEVPDLVQAEHFYRSFGLETEQERDTLRLRSPGRDNDEGLLTAGRDKRLHHVSFYADSTDIAPFADHLRAHSLQVSDKSPAGWRRDGLWFQDPWGTWINISPHIPTSTRQDSELTEHRSRFADRVDIALWQEVGPAKPPLKLGHLLMFTQDWQKAEQFYCRVLGMRPTDRSAGKVTFLAAGRGVIDHHCFGLINSTHRGFQHASFQVSSFDQIGLSALRMQKAGYTESFGVGRHAIASNLFHYSRDPWGSWIEYYADIDRISDDWVCRDWTDRPYIWGPEWSSEFWSQQMNGNFEPR